MSQRSSSSSNRKSFQMSTYSMNKSGPLSRASKTGLKEEIIQKKIQEIFKEKEVKMIRTIEATIQEDKLKIYKLKRSDFEEELNEIEKDRTRIMKRKKNKKERMKALRVNSRQRLYFIVKALNETVQHYKMSYYENDFYRMKRLLAMSRIEKTPQAQLKSTQEFLNNLFHSPFKDDRRFCIRFLMVETRDRLNDSRLLVDHLFFDKIFELMVSNSSDEQNTLMSYDIVCNLLKDDKYRAKLRDKNYIRAIFDQVMKTLDYIDERRLEKVSHMVTLIAFHSDMLQQIVKIRMMHFIIKLVDAKYSVTIRSNAVLAISLLTYHDFLFQELINNNVIDMIMDLCMDPALEISIKRFSTLALVHFALSKESITILLEKGVMDLFNALSRIDNAQIHTNVSWIFLALCNNGITGKQMLMNGITRDMFLVSCNPQFSQIRHLVIAGFAELGRADNLQEQQIKPLPRTLQQIKEKAIVGTQEMYQVKDAANTINVLLRFTLSSESQFKLTAFWALKDYILLNNECLVDDLKGVIQAFVNGAAETSDKVKAECANAISFLITHHLVFTAKEAAERQVCFKTNQEYEFNKDLCYILDALMYLTGQESLEVRTRAFSTLSSLSTYASQTDHVMAQIQQDMKLAAGESSKTYYQFIEDRLQKSQKAFRNKFETENIEKDYAGLYCLLRLAQDPDEAGTEEAARMLRQFYFPEKTFKVLETRESRNFTSNKAKADTEESKGENPMLIEIDQNLTDEEKRHLSVNMFNNELDERILQLDELNEKFFMYVFKALLYTQNRRILYQLLDVINFYIKHETPRQKDVMNPATILWMLKIIDTHKVDQDLCLLAAKTVLKVVNNHQIVFDYQEMSIIKKFNKALDNIGCQKNHIQDLTLAQGSEKQFISFARDDSQPTRTTPASAALRIEKKHSMMHDEIMEEEENKSETVLQEQHSVSRGEIAGQSKPVSVQSPEEDNNISDLKELGLENKVTVIVHQQPRIIEAAAARSLTDQTSQNEMKEIASQRDPSSQCSDKLKVDTNMPIQESIQKQEEPSIKTTEEIEKKTRIYISVDQSQFAQTTLSEAPPVSPTQRIFGGRKASLKVDQNGQVSLSEDFTIEKVDAKKGELRDTIIKSFMVIFTNEKSQHLLLNKDIVDIAFCCLENVFMISQEAKFNLARLMSIILKFPQVQERLMNERIILGIVYLLQNHENESDNMLGFLVTACSYISLNFKFINSKLSLRILQALVPILVRLLSKPPTNTTKMSESFDAKSATFGNRGNAAILNQTDAFLEQRLQSHIMTPIDYRSERENCVYAIANLLKGHPQNVSYFTECNASKMVLKEILRMGNTESYQLSELLSSCIMQVSQQKHTFHMFLQFSEENLSLLPACLEKCFNISDSWYTCTQEILIYKKLFVDDDKEELIDGETQTDRDKRHVQKQKKKNLDSSQITNIDYKNIERIKTLEKLEQKEDKSYAMAPLCKLRNHCYSIAASCMLNNFNQTFMLSQCKLLKRIIEDLKMDERNDFIFQSLLDILRTIKKDPQAIKMLFQDHGRELTQLISDMDENPSKRNALFSTLVYLMLKAPEEFFQVEKDILGGIFGLAMTIDDDDIKENLLWLQSSLIEIDFSEEQHEKAIELCTEFKSAQVFLANLKSQNEILVLQAIRGLKTLAAIPQFRAIILIDIGDDLFMALAYILAQRMQEFTLCALEIEVELVLFLAYITESSAASKDPLTIAAKRRVVQQGFVEHYLRRISQLEYKVFLQDDTDELFDANENASPNLELNHLHTEAMNHHNPWQGANSDPLGIDSAQIIKIMEGSNLDRRDVDNKFDRVERETDFNHLIEGTIQLAANVTELAETQNELVNGQGQVLKQAMALLDLIVTKCVVIETQQIELANYAIGNRDVCQYLSKIIVNLCMSTSSAGPGVQSIQDYCVAVGVGPLMVRVCRSVIDYELHSNLYRAMCLLAVSPSQENRKHFVESDCLSEIQNAAEFNRYFRVRRTCSNGLEQIGPELFTLNETIMRKRRKAAKRNVNKSWFKVADQKVTALDDQDQGPVNIS